MEQLLTSGAHRALQLAARIANSCAAAQVEPLHLLWALLLEESQAAETLRHNGLDRTQVAAELPLPPAARDLPPATEADAGQKLPQGDAVRMVVQEARQQVALDARFAEVSSDHLLCGLAVVDSPVSALLARHGMTPETLAEHASEHTRISGDPLEADITLNLPERRPSDRFDVLRIVDAAANRAREGMRVLEDHVRFTLDDAHLTELLKTWRHNLAAVLAEVGAGELLAARDTQRDVGTTVGTQREKQRHSSTDVLQANFKRVQEATRTLEEFGKLISVETGVRLERLRYESYTLEKAVLTTESAGTRLEGRNLCLIVTESLCRRGSGPVVREAVAAGVRMVQLREKQMADNRLLEMGRRVRKWTRDAGAIFIMNDRPDLAVLTDADGVHVGQEELSVRDARRIVGAEKIVGVSTHTIAQARQAVKDGADYIGVGPVFSTATKSFDRLAGLEFVRQIAAEITLPGYAIGGITPENIQDVVDAGAFGVAVSSAICSAEHPGKAAHGFAKYFPANAEYRNPNV